MSLKYHPMKKSLFLVVLMMALTACSGARPPDETVVVDGPSLLLPPDYQLRPPQEGAAGPVPRRERADARAILTGEAIDSTVTPDEQPSWLAERTGVATDPNIREELAADAEQQKEEEKGFLGRFWSRDKAE